MPRFGSSTLKMKCHWDNLVYLTKHKLAVARECFKRGMYWRGLTHDLSKLHPTEWFAYAEMFFGIGKLDNGFDKAWNRQYLKETGKLLPHHLTKQGVKDSFDRAFLHHVHNNSHHWQHWVLLNNDGTISVLEMPIKDAQEMVCDWIGAGITKGNDVEKWYEDHRDKMLLHPNTRQFVEFLIYERRLS